MDESAPKKIEKAASEQLGIQRWDRPQIFRDTADAAADADLPYWLVLLLSGAIATLGLATDSAAVVIGAMLVAPLLSPVVGLGLALATGDGRLAFESAVVVLASTIGVIALAALLTALLPFQTITGEIAARTRPTTLDLAIAVFSGLAGALVTVARGHRLSAAIPGVAISVALIPPLGVAGFGVGLGWEGALIRGSLLLYGANLGGIVLSAMFVFMLIGMHRPDVLRAADQWHLDGERTGLAAWTDQWPWVQSLGNMHSPWARVGLVLAFVVAVAVPLSATLQQIARESRVRAAVDRTAEALFEIQGRASILNQRSELGEEGTRVYLRVGTAEWFGQRAREEFERRASAAAAEPVRLVLEQLPVSRGDVDALAELFPRTSSPPTAVTSPVIPPQMPELLQEIRARLEDAAAALTPPAGVDLVGTELSVGAAGGTAARVGYTAPAPLPAAAEEILARQLARALDVPGTEVRLDYVSPAPRYAGDTVPAPAALADVPDLLRRNERLVAEVRAGAEVDSARVDSVVVVLRALGVPLERVARERGGAGLRVRVRPAAVAAPG